MVAPTRDSRPGPAPLPVVDIRLEEEVPLREVTGPSGQCPGVRGVQDETERVPLQARLI